MRKEETKIHIFRRFVRLRKLYKGRGQKYFAYFKLQLLNLIRTTKMCYGIFFHCAMQFVNLIISYLLLNLSFLAF